jgi:hypothetical protein
MHVGWVAVVAAWWIVLMVRANILHAVTVVAVAMEIPANNRITKREEETGRIPLLLAATSLRRSRSSCSKLIAYCVGWHCFRRSG